MIRSAVCYSDGDIDWLLKSLGLCLPCWVNDTLPLTSDRDKHSSRRTEDVISLQGKHELDEACQAVTLMWRQLLFTFKAHSSYSSSFVLFVIIVSSHVFVLFSRFNSVNKHFCKLIYLRDEMTSVWSQVMDSLAQHKDWRCESQTTWLLRSRNRARIHLRAGNLCQNPSGPDGTWWVRA